MEWQEFKRDAHILIVDDEPGNVLVLEHMLADGACANVKSTSDAREVLALFDTFAPDLVLLDIRMPYMNGFEVLEELKQRIPGGTYLPILVLSGEVSGESRQRALAMGAKDFVSKPFDSCEVMLRVDNLLEARFLHLQLQDQNQVLEERVRERTRELSEAQIEILRRLALAAEFRDDHTGEHTQRVGRTAVLIAQALALPQEDVELLQLAAPLHDVGKLGIPDRILLKPVRLSAEERELIKAHAEIGSKILAGSRFRLLQMADEIALTHHERWDGKGYFGLEGEEIPLPGRIVAVADVFDALTHHRPYKDAWTVGDAVLEIRRQSGRQFDPKVVEAFLQVQGRGHLLSPEDGRQGFGLRVAG